MTSDLMQSQ